MIKKPVTTKAPAEQVVKDIWRATNKFHSSEGKIRIVLSGLRGEDCIAELCRKEGIAQSLYYRLSKEFLEVGKKRLAGDTARQPVLHTRFIVFRKTNNKLQFDCRISQIARIAGSMDHLKTLRVFVAVAEVQSFANGAANAGTSAPSATRAINILEEHLGARLFTRTTRKVRLTDVGKAYLEDVKEVLLSLQAANEAAAGKATSPAGKLRITCPQEFGRLYITPLLLDFLDQHKDVTADVLMVDRVVNIVEEGFDVALRIGPLPSSGLTEVRVGEVRQVMCGAPSYFATYGRPQNLNELPGHRIVSVSSLHTGEHLRFGKHGTENLKIAPRLAVSSVAAAIDVARRGCALCQVLAYQIGPDLEAGTLEIVLEAEEAEPLPIHLVHAEGRRMPLKLRSFIDFVADRLRSTTVFHQSSS